MDWTTLLFSFNGRINRGKYWLAFFIYMAVWTTFFAGSLVWLGGLNFDDLLSLAGAGLMIWLIGFILLVAGTWSGLALGVNGCMTATSGWWILLFWLGPSILGGWRTATPDLGGGFIFGLPRRRSRSGPCRTRVLARHPRSEPVRPGSARPSGLTTKPAEDD